MKPPKWPASLTCRSWCSRCTCSAWAILSPFPCAHASRPGLSTRWTAIPPLRSPRRAGCLWRVPFPQAYTSDPSSAGSPRGPARHFTPSGMQWASTEGGFLTKTGPLLCDRLLPSPQVPGHCVLPRGVVLGYGSDARARHTRVPLRRRRNREPGLVIHPRPGRRGAKTPWRPSAAAVMVSLVREELAKPIWTPSSTPHLLRLQVLRGYAPAPPPILKPDVCSYDPGSMN